jgi:hypothetical protein
MDYCCPACNPTVHFKMIVDKYEAIIGKGMLEMGHGHIVFSDGNVDDEAIIYCFGQRNEDDGWDKEVLDAIDDALIELLKLPLNLREDLSAGINED